MERVTKETGVEEKQRGGRVVFEVLYPCGGEVAETTPFAKRLGSLEGKTICELSNAGWEHDRIFPVIRELLQKRFPTANIIPYDELPLGRGRAGIDSDEAADAVLKKGCDAVVTGMAA